jgi:hypothetical protein
MNVYIYQVSNRLGSADAWDESSSLGLLPTGPPYKQRPHTRHRAAKETWMFPPIERLLSRGSAHVARPLGLATRRSGDPSAFPRPNIAVEGHPDMVIERLDSN